MDSQRVKNFVSQQWDQLVMPTLMDYIKIPNKSPYFDPHWQVNGFMMRATKLLADWCQQQALDNMQLEVIQLENRTPVIFIEIPGQSDETILLYGHLDKQPEMTGWKDGLSPWQPVVQDDKLYGRGAADDGYAAFASLLAVKALQDQQLPHARCIILIEASEESGSLDLPYYVEALEDRIGTPSLVICLDSGCGNYNQLWLTTSLRGLMSGTLKISVLDQGIHSGTGSGVVPSCFRILRLLLDRIEKASNGEILLADCYVEIPPLRKQQALQAAQILENIFLEEMPFAANVQAESSAIADLILKRTWYPALSIIGLNGLPTIENAGNVTIPTLSVKLSMRLPPTCSPDSAFPALKNILEQTPPYQAHVRFDRLEANAGWDAPHEAPWLTAAAKQASETYFGHQAAYIGEGGTIPFISMLGNKFPQAQFFITGVLGPGANAHGPNEFLHIPTAKKLTACVAQIIYEHMKRTQ